MAPLTLTETESLILELADLSDGLKNVFDRVPKMIIEHVERQLCCIATMMKILAASFSSMGKQVIDRKTA